LHNNRCQLSDCHSWPEFIEIQLVLGGQVSSDLNNLLPESGTHREEALGNDYMILYHALVGELGVVKYYPITLGTGYQF
jgi:hypothetical protein